MKRAAWTLSKVLLLVCPTLVMHSQAQADWLPFKPAHRESARRQAPDRLDRIESAGVQEARQEQPRAGQGRQFRYRQATRPTDLRNAMTMLPDRRCPKSTGGSFSIDAAVIAGGGSSISAGNLQLTGTIGQAASATLVGDSYTVFDGFWHPIDGTSDVIFSDGFDF